MSKEKMNFIPVKKSQIKNLKENSLYLELYSSDEIILLGLLEKLFLEWFNAFSDNHDDYGYIIRDFSSLDMSFDGFYPGYLKQKTKLLFIGIEGRGLSGINYIACLYEAIKDKCIGKKTLQQSAFHKRILYLTLALQSGQNKFNDIPYTNEISLIFGSDECSYAFMNLSKFSNENESPKADWELINKSVEISTQKRNFINEEIFLLNPDIIITMNFANYFNSIGEINPIESENNQPYVDPYELVINRKSILLLDTYHFSAYMEDKDVFFDPIINTIIKYKEKFNLNCYCDSKAVIV